mgnify:CR=1 FL=1
MEQIFSQLFYEVEKHRDTVLVTLIADRGSCLLYTSDAADE